jgi:hypothetical protein
MCATKDRHAEVGITYHADPEATPHQLLNAATEWIQCARGLAGLLADLVHEADTVDCQRMAHGFEAIAALALMGVQCTAQAHVRMCWAEQAPLRPVQ